MTHEARPHHARMAENGPPPQAAGVLYPGEVMHARLKPFGHRFVYRVFSLLVDLDRLDELDRMSALFSVNKAEPRLVPRERPCRARGRDASAPLPTGCSPAPALPSRAARILLLAYPRIFGYVFNPISVYFAYDARRRARRADLCGAQHVRRAPHLCRAGRAGRIVRGRRPAERAPRSSTSRPSSTWARAIISACCRPARSCGCASTRPKRANRCWRRPLPAKQKRWRRRRSPPAS